MYDINTDNPTVTTGLHPARDNMTRTVQKLRHFGHFSILDTTPATASDNPICCASTAVSITMRAVSSMLCGRYS